jgi:hypothetical protein
MQAVLVGGSMGSFALVILNFIALYSNPSVNIPIARFRSLVSLVLSTTQLLRSGDYVDHCLDASLLFY